MEDERVGTRISRDGSHRLLDLMISGKKNWFHTVCHFILLWGCTSYLISWEITDWKYIWSVNESGAQLFTFPLSESSGFSWSWGLTADEDVFAHSAHTPVWVLLNLEESSQDPRAGACPFIPSIPDPAGFSLFQPWISQKLWSSSLWNTSRLPYGCRKESVSAGEEKEKWGERMTLMDRGTDSGEGVWWKAVGPGSFVTTLCGLSHSLHTSVYPFPSSLLSPESRVSLPQYPIQVKPEV